MIQVLSTWGSPSVSFTFKSTFMKIKVFQIILKQIDESGEENHQFFCHKIVNKTCILLF